MKKLLLMISVLACQIFNYCNAQQTYYVDATNGLDTNTGLSPATAWNSCTKVNEAKFLPGDSVLFKRGEIFRERLTGHKGSPSGYITFSAYGKGEKPLFLASTKRKNPADWIKEKENIWKTREDLNVQTVGNELMENPDMNSNINNWNKSDNSNTNASSDLSWTNKTGTYKSGKGGGRLICLKRGSNPADIQLWNENVKVSASKWYKLTFAAKADKQFMIPSGGIGIIKNSEPRYSLVFGSSKAVNIGTSWNTFTVYFKTRLSSAEGRINFRLGDVIPDNTTFYLDAFSFKECASDPGTLVADVGNLIFNNEAACAFRVWKESDLNEQGRYLYDTDNKIVKLYSIENPGTFYSNIELSNYICNIELNNIGYMIFDNLDLRYSSLLGLSTDNVDHIWAKNLNISYIGGGLQKMTNGKPTRLGNGLQFWNGAQDCIVESCTFDQIYDAAVTPQGSVNNTQGYEVHNIYIRNNIINHCEYSYELWGRGADTSKVILQDIYFENNTCLNAGSVWSHEQRPDGHNGTHLMFYGFRAKVSNLFVRNNIFFESTDYGANFYNGSQVNKVTLENNCWFESSGAVAKIGRSQVNQGIIYDYTIFADYKKATGQDFNSIAADPMLNSDYTLKTGSPCIDRGELLPVTVTTDFNMISRPKGRGNDIGAFESAPVK